MLFSKDKLTTVFLITPLREAPLPDRTEIRDFTKRRHFPGTTGNPFDIFLHRYDRLEKIPAVVLALLLFGIATLASGANWPKTLVIYGFFISDWLLIYLLPKFNKSFGPPKPVVLTLAVLRSLVVWTPAAVDYPLQFLGTLLVIYGFWIEPHTIHVTRQVLLSSKINTDQTIRILHLGDLHLERISRREKQLAGLIDQLQPDLILFSGDVLNLSRLRDSESIKQAREILASWRAPFGVFAVSGSPAVDLPELLPEIYKDLSVRRLDNQEIRLSIHGDALNIIGVSCSHRPFEDERNVSAVEPDNEFHLLLYHSPDLAPVAAARGFDLQLSGHTHGGQVRLPLIGALFTGSLYGHRYSAGRYTIGKMVLYVTRGIGMEGAGAPRVRLFCPPEIILWELTSDNNKTG